MIRPIVFRAPARHDFLDACTRYEEQRKGLGDRFEAAVERTLEALSASPESFPVVHRDVRRALVRPFPYAVFYRTIIDTIHVLAIMHGKRHPRVWKSRAEEV